MTCGCQYIGPEQDPQRGPLQFCGRVPLWPGRSYCEDHVWKIYQKGTAQGMSRKNRQIERELEELKKLEEMDDEQS